MNDRDPQGTHDHDDERAVDDFFAAHRRQVVDHAADDQTWHVIRERAGRGARSRGVWFLGGAVAASAVAVAVLVGQGLGGPEALSPAGPGGARDQAAVTGPATPDPTTPAEGPATGDATSAPAPTGEPTETVEPTQQGPAAVTFPLPALAPAAEIILVEDPTGEESDLRVARTTYDCEAGTLEWECPALAVSEDAGRTWTARVDMYAAGYYRAVASRDSVWMWGPAAAAAAGRPGVPDPAADLVRSDDGGRTWNTVPTRGEAPIGVEAFRSTLVVVTDGCEDGAPGSCAEVVITDVTADDATSGRREVTLRDLPQPQHVPAGWFAAADVSATYDAVYVTYLATTYRIADGEQTATVVRRPSGQCLLQTAPESPDSLVHWCHDAEAIQLSHDGGATWQEVEGPGGFPNGVASNDGRRLVVSTEEALWVGVAAGEEWQQVMPWSPGRTLLEAHGGRSMSFGGAFRYDPQGPPRSSQRWTSEDDGQTWTEQPPVEVRMPD